MAKGKWQVFEITQRGSKYFVVGRLLDPGNPPLVDNVEFETNVTHGRDAAQEFADWLNRQEEQKAG